VKPQRAQESARTKWQMHPLDFRELKPLHLDNQPFLFTRQNPSQVKIAKVCADPHVRLVFCRESRVSEAERQPDAELVNACLLLDEILNTLEVSGSKRKIILLPFVL
jgi:hypothetical protein